MISLKRGKKRAQWWGEYLAFRVLEVGLSVFSIAFLYRIGALLGEGGYHLSLKYRSIVRRNLTMASDPNDLASPSRSEVKEVFARNGGNLLTMLAVGVGRSQKCNALQYAEEKWIEQRLEDNGVIVVLAHMGNWELLTEMTNILPSRPTIGALYRPLNNPLMNKRVLDKREKVGMRLISAKNPSKAIFQLLKEKGIMCILSDQRIGSKGVQTSFFGQVTPCSRLALVAHRKTQAPIVVVSMQGDNPGSWKLKLHPVKSPTQQRIIDTLAKAMATSLGDCFWFQDRWQEFPRQGKIQEQTLPRSTLHKPKVLPWIVESRAVFDSFPNLLDHISIVSYPFTVWDEGGDPSLAYFAIGEGKAFCKACHRVGVKRGLLSPELALRYLTGE